MAKKPLDTRGTALNFEFQAIVAQIRYIVCVTESIAYEFTCLFVWTKKLISHPNTSTLDPGTKKEELKSS